MASTKEVAEWLAKRAKSGDWMYQEEIVQEIASQFGEEFTYENENGNLAIGKDVLREFRKLTEDTVVWDRAEKAWRWWEPSDDPGRLQDF